MYRTAMALLTTLAAGAAHATPLGLDPSDVPEAPASRKPDVTFKERRAAVLRGEVPEQLAPFRYLKNGRLSSIRYYTEDGEVLRRREVVMVLEASEPSKQCGDGHLPQA